MRAFVMLTAASSVGLMTASAAEAADVLYDNGPVNGVNGYSNATEGVFAERRTMLDDFVVPAGGWTLTELRWNSVWDTLMAGSGTGAEISIRSGVGAPGTVIAVANVTGYSEVATGNILFSREEATNWATFDPIALDEGHYWFEATVVGPENNFWLTADQNFNECWVNYDGVLQSGSAQFGVASDINFILGGVPGPGAMALFGVGALGRSRRRRATAGSL